MLCFDDNLWIKKNFIFFFIKYFFWVSMGGALLAPIFVTLGEGMANALGSYGSVFVFS